jgi:hypothetical protein
MVLPASLNITLVSNGGKEVLSYPRIQQLIRIIMEVKGLEPPINYKKNNMSYRY